MEPGEGPGVRRHVHREQGARGETLMSLRKRGEGQEGERDGSWAGEVPSRGVRPQRRGVADPKKRGLAERNRANQEELAKAEEGKQLALPEFQYRRGGFGRHWLQRTGWDWEMR